MALSPISTPFNPSSNTAITEKFLNFSKEIQEDKELFFLINVMLEALPTQLKRIEDLYLYEEIEKGEIFEALSEKAVTLTIDQSMALIKVLAGLSYYREEVLCIHKVCKGHFKEKARQNVRYRNEEHIKKTEKKIYEEWKQKKNIKPCSIKVEQSVYRNLSFLKRFCDFYVSYTHVDNTPECSHPKTKTPSIQDVSFTSVLEQFEAKIKSSNLDSQKEWAVLAQKIFGSNLELI